MCIIWETILLHIAWIYCVTVLRVGPIWVSSFCPIYGRMIVPVSFGSDTIPRRLSRCIFPVSVDQPSIHVCHPFPRKIIVHAFLKMSTSHAFSIWISPVFWFACTEPFHICRRTITPRFPDTSISQSCVLRFPRTPIVPWFSHAWILAFSGISPMVISHWFHEIVSSETQRIVSLFFCPRSSTRLCSVHWIVTSVPSATSSFPISDSHTQRIMRIRFCVIVWSRNIPFSRIGSALLHMNVALISRIFPQKT